MRVFLLTILCLLAIGCNSDPRCRRETALLRAEILDLEDKYYLLKSERDALASGQPSTMQAESYYTDTGEPYFTDSEIIYDDTQIGDVIYDGSTSYDGVIMEGATTQREDYPAGMNGRASMDASAGSSGSYLNAGQPSLAPDDSILPLHSSQSPHSQILRDAPSVIGSEQASPEFSLQLPENMSNTGSPIVRTDDSENGELNVLLNSPEVDSSEFEIGFERTQSFGKITEVIINGAATRGHDVDGNPGDEGLDLLVQPRSADGQIQLVAGQLTVSVIDPNQAPEQQRIGLWKFLASETELFFANDELGSFGILLHLPWDQQTPVNRMLIVHVRYVTPDGRSLTTSSEVQITPPEPNYSPHDPLVSGWTKRDTRWIPGLAKKLQAAKTSNWQNRQSASSPSTNPGRANPGIRLTPARPAKATISKPAWRPIR